MLATYGRAALSGGTRPVERTLPSGRTPEASWRPGVDLSKNLSRGRKRRNPRKWLCRLRIKMWWTCPIFPLQLDILNLESKKKANYGKVQTASDENRFGKGATKSA